jgi:hypothetical protein
MPVGSPFSWRRVCPISDKPSIPDGLWASLFRDGSLLSCVSVGSQGKPQLIGFEYDAPDGPIGQFGNLRCGIVLAMRFRSSIS